MSQLQAWLYAFRLRTLPLAFSSIVTGSAIAYTQNPAGFSYPVFALCLLTTLLLQILSNLANDYGDSQKGTDNHERIGPQRAIQAGLLTPAQIKTGIALTVLLCLLSGCALIYQAFKGAAMAYPLFFFALGVGAIAAAIKYTVGSNAYGYRGLGDAFVLLFFGPVGVCGSYYLLAHTLYYPALLPAMAIGLLATGVLNLNNMRDIAGDARAGKNTLVVKMGLPKARLYHRALVIAAFALCIAYVLLTFYSTMQLLFIITLPLFRRHLVAVKAVTDPKYFDPLLKQLAISTFIFALLFALGQIVDLG